jgi:mono/diheme cytochrome c family protein
MNEKTRNRFVALIGAGVVGLMLAGCNATKTEPAPGGQPQAAGPQEVFQQHCANCHGGNLQGGFGPSLEHVGSKYSKEQILNIIQHGKGQMPSQDYVDKKDQEKLADWLSQKK